MDAGKVLAADAHVLCYYPVIDTRADEYGAHADNGRHGLAQRFLI